MKLKQPQGLAEGIYFNLSNDAYHDDPALSHSGMTKVLMNWPDYWVTGPLNHQRERPKPTDAMKLGDRTGMCLLEHEKFVAKFYNTRTPKGHPGIGLSSVTYSDIMDAVESIREVPIGNQYFSGGYGEVTFIWRCPITGTMLRAKLDYLHHIGAVDFKRIAAIDNATIGRAVKNQGLDIQRYVYLEAIKFGRAWLKKMTPKQLAAFADDQRVDVEWLKAFRDSQDLFFRFVFQRSSPPFVWEIRELETEVAEEGERATLVAIERYRRGIEKYGLEKPPNGDGELKTISQYHVPRRDYDLEI